MTIAERKKAVSKLTDIALLHHEKELQHIEKKLKEDLKIVHDEITKRANKVIKKMNPKNEIE